MRKEKFENILNELIDLKKDLPKVGEDYEVYSILQKAYDKILKICDFQFIYSNIEKDWRLKYK